MENRAFGRADLMAAMRARVATAGRHAVKAIGLATFAGSAVRETLGENVIQAGRIIRELLVELINCKAFCSHGRYWIDLMCNANKIGVNLFV